MVARRAGAMLRATRRSVKAAPHLTDPRYAGAIAAAEALARLIDEAVPGESGPVVVRAVPHYLGVLNELLLTPRSVPVRAGPAPAPVPVPALSSGEGGTAGKDTPARGKVASFAQAAQRRRAGAEAG